MMMMMMIPTAHQLLVRARPVIAGSNIMYVWMDGWMLVIALSLSFFLCVHAYVHRYIPTTHASIHTYYIPTYLPTYLPLFTMAIGSSSRGIRR